MKNIRTKKTPIQRAMKIVTSITLLAMLFVLVLAGTLSGAFGVEENLVQNGKIEGNVASADAPAVISSEYSVLDSTAFNYTTASKFIGQGAGWTDSAKSLDGPLIWSNANSDPTCAGTGGGTDTIGKITQTDTSMTAPGVNDNPPAAAGAIYKITYTAKRAGTLKINVSAFVNVKDGGSNSFRSTTQVAFASSSNKSIKFRTSNQEGTSDYNQSFTGADGYVCASVQSNNRANEDTKSGIFSSDFGANETKTLYVYVAFTRSGTGYWDGSLIEWSFNITDVRFVSSMPWSESKQSYIITSREDFDLLSAYVANGNTCSNYNFLYNLTLLLQVKATENHCYGRK